MNVHAIQPWFTLEIEVKEGSAEEFLQVMSEVAAASRREAGVLQYDLLRNAKDCNRFILVQRYASLEAALAHMTEPHSQTALQKLSGLVAAPFVQTDYTRAV